MLLMYVQIMANKGERGSPGENIGDKDVKFKGKLSVKHTHKKGYLEKPERIEGFLPSRE